MKKIVTNLKYLTLALIILVGLSVNVNQAFATWTYTTTHDIPYVVTASNIPPVCNAGIDRPITLPTSSVSIPSGGATATDSDGTITSTVWSKISGTGGSITNGTTLTPTFSSLSAGSYTFRLTATDNQSATCTDDMIVTVNASNIPPTANAGADQSITQPSSAVSVSGSGNDPDGSITAYAWSQVGSSPSVATIATPSSPSTSITNLTTVGTYTFRLTVTDNGTPGLTGSDDMTVTVNAGGSVPVVSISASPTSGVVNVVHGVLTWGATNSPSSCNATGDWSGTQAVTGNSVDQGVLTSIRTYTYTLTCTNGSGTSAPASATVIVNANVKNGVCSSPQTHFSCSAGISINNVTGGSSWTWDCQGTTSTASCSESFPTGQPQCNDSIDNDGDALIDYPADPGCSSLLDNNEKNTKIKEIEL